MKFKLDENFGKRALDIFSEHGHDTHTVLQENLQGKPDTIIYTVAREENVVW